ncbi:hypothetical protein ACIRL0_00585 [Streptomyces sp. NPDC102365]|uniref:hypothetical protein n=1 Tax=Streptomyces sp. NPDC102365 TaxID=3366162 RepID=UPI0038096791
MNGRYDEIADEPADDGGAGVAVWQMTRLLEGARQRYAEATEQPTYLDVLLAPLSAPQGGEAHPGA